MSTKCYIIFDNRNGVYHSGENLNGHVKLQTENSKSVRAISIKVVGYEKIAWSEGGKSSTNYSAHQQYLNSCNYVLGSPDGESFNLPPGIYEYTFNCHLPIELPTSMEEQCGRIKYKVIVTIDRELRLDNIYKKDFSINKASDLNDDSSNKLPKRNTGLTEIAPFFGCCCFKGTDIKAELQIPCGGFVPGQKLPFQLIVYNDSNNNLSGATVKLMKCYTYHSIEPYMKQKYNENVIDTRYCADIPRHINRDFKYNFIVPLIPPTYRTKFIRIDYKLQAEIRLFGYSTKKFYIEIPITIGTIPINDFDPENVQY